MSNDNDNEEIDFGQVAERLLKPLVPHPDDVVVKTQVTDAAVNIEVSVHADDTGRVIGRSGATIRALRRVMEAAGARHGTTVTFDLKDA